MSHLIQELFGQTLRVFSKEVRCPFNDNFRHRWLFHRSFASARQLDHRTLLDLRYWNFLGESASWLQYLDVVTAERPALAIGLGSFDGFFGRLADFPGTTIDRRSWTPSHKYAPTLAPINVNLAATIKFGKREFPSLREQKNQARIGSGPILTRRAGTTASHVRADPITDVR
jgi:hypothetical protein